MFMKQETALAVPTVAPGDQIAAGSSICRGCGLAIQPILLRRRRLPRALLLQRRSGWSSKSYAQAAIKNCPQPFESLGRENPEPLVITSDAFFSNRGEELGALALRHRVPAIYQHTEFTEGGGLMSYGGNIAESYRQAGVYVG
jgi:hypothetical protein